MRSKRLVTVTGHIVVDISCIYVINIILLSIISPPSMHGGEYALIFMQDQGRFFFFAI